MEPPLPCVRSSENNLNFSISASAANNESRVYECIPSPVSLKPSPVTIQMQKSAHTRLLNAHELGAQEAKKIIRIFEKKKAEIGTQFCDSPEGNSLEIQTINTRVNDLVEDLHEEVLLVKDFNEDSVDSSCANTLKRRSIKLSPIFTEPNYGVNQAFTFPSVSINDTIEQKNASVQHNSIFFPSYQRQLTNKRSIEIQLSEKENLTQAPFIKLSETSVQCDMKQDTCNGISSQVSHVSKFYDNFYEASDSETKLHYFIKRLIHNHRNKTTTPWDDYIKELKDKHRPHEQDKISYETCDICGYEKTSSTLTPRRVQSTYFLDNFYERSTSAGGTRKHKDNTFENESLKTESRISSLYFPNSTYCDDQTHHKMNSFRSRSPPDFGRSTVDPFCYPSTLSNSIHSIETVTPKIRKLCRNIYNTPHACDFGFDISMRPQTGQSYDCGKFEADFMNNWIEHPNILLKNQNDSRDDTFYKYNKGANDSGKLSAVPEESYKLKNNSNRRRGFSPPNKGEPNNIKNENKNTTGNKDDSKSSLNVIENKLDTLIESIHALIQEVKHSGSQEHKIDKKISILPQFTRLDASRCFRKGEKINKTKSDPLAISAGNQLLKSVGQIILERSDINLKEIITTKPDKNCDIKVIVSSKTHTTYKSTNTMTVEPYYEIPNTHRENKVSKVRRNKSKYSHVICEGSPHALQLTVDFLVKDPPNMRLGKKGKNRVDSSSVSTIADMCINTDPLTMQQISSVTLNKLWSMFPIVDYFWSFLPITPAYKSTTYICEICKSSFNSASELSEHIKIHYSDENDCATCRDLTNANNKRTIRAMVPLPKPFCCKYCGKDFARAYARQLHEVCCEMGREIEERKDSGRQSLVLLK